MLTAGMESMTTARHSGFIVETDSTLDTHQPCMENLRFTVQIPEHQIQDTWAQYDTGEKQEHPWDNWLRTSTAGSEHSEYNSLTVHSARQST